MNSVCNAQQLIGHIRWIQHTSHQLLLSQDILDFFCPAFAEFSRHLPSICWIQQAMPSIFAEFSTLPSICWIQQSSARHSLNSAGIYPAYSLNSAVICPAFAEFGRYNTYRPATHRAISLHDERNRIFFTYWYSLDHVSFISWVSSYAPSVCASSICTSLVVSGNSIASICSSVCAFSSSSNTTLEHFTVPSSSRFEIPYSSDFCSIMDVSQHHAHTGAVSEFLLCSLSGWDVFVCSTSESS